MVVVLWRDATIGDVVVVEVMDVAGSSEHHGHRSIGIEAMTW